MLFRYENEMTAVVERWLQAQGLETRCEFTTPWGVCDLMGLAFDDDQVRKRLAYRQTRAIGPIGRIAVLEQIPDKRHHRSVRPEVLQERFSRFLPEEETKKHIEKLIEGRFVVRTHRGTLQKINGWMSLHKRLVAVELKLTKTAEVLQQAASNVAIADESYIGLPREIAYRMLADRRGNELRHLGIGLLAVSNDACEELISAGRGLAKKMIVVQIHCVERFWRTGR